jgi:putative DNA primase/helicase
MQLILQTTDVVSDAKNCKYPHRAVVTNAGELQEAVKMDHVCAEYRGDYRSVTNFLRSNVIVMDCDNDHSDSPADWITSEKLDRMLPDVSYAIAPSRHHLMVKQGKSARPRFHVYFEINEIQDAEQYTRLKRAIQKAFSFFDDNALDAARFIFGAETGETLWHDGWMTIEEEVPVECEEEVPVSGGPIREGSRNNTLSRFAGRVLKRYGETEKSHAVFLEEAAKCDPPLEKEELNTIWFSALKFFRKTVKMQDGYVAPEEYNSDFTGASLKPEDYSDIGQAKMLAREYGNELKFTAATDYLRFDGQVWCEDKQMAVGAMEEFLDLQLADAKDQLSVARDALVSAGVDEQAVRSGGKTLEKLVPVDALQLFYDYLAAQQYFSFVMKRRDMKYVVSALNAAKPMVSISISDLDRNENLLNTPYAVYNLRKGMDGEKLHDPADLITKITQCSPGEGGMDIWESALELFFCGDQELIRYVQQIVGMAAIGKVYQEHLIIAYGGGANGKSTFWNTIARVLGTYSGKVSAEILTMGNKHNAKPEMAELKGRRLIIASEMEEGMRLNTAVVKQLCSTDEIQGEKKYKDPFHFIPSHTLVLYTNHLPKVGANDDGIWRRLIVIPFNAKITGSGDVKNYSDHLFEHAGAAIMQWIIEGAKTAIHQDFKSVLPECVKDAIAAYREENDWLGRFLEECCETGDGLEAKSGEFYQQYRAYCIQNGEYVRGTSDFYSAVDKAGFSRKKTNRGVIVQGVQLKSGNDFI